MGYFGGTKFDPASPGDIGVTAPGAVACTNFMSSGDIGFFGQPAVGRIAVAPPYDLFTTQDPGESYGLNEQQMLTNLRIDVENLHRTLYEFVVSLQNIGLV